MRSRAVFAFCGMFAAVVPLRAQICTGTASFAAHPARIGGEVGVSKNTTLWGVNVAAGRSTGLFAAIEGGVLDDNRAVDTGMRFSLDGGWAIDANPEKTLQFCPRLSYARQAGPDVDRILGEEQNDVNFYGIGASLGFLIGVSKAVDLVPFVGGSLMAAQRQTALDSVATQHYNRFFSVVVGVGVVVNRTVTLQPSVSIPVYLDDGQSMFRLAVAIGFGPRQRAR